jgi:hypothetical protein
MVGPKIIQTSQIESESDYEQDEFSSFSSNSNDVQNLNNKFQSDINLTMTPIPSRNNGFQETDEMLNIFRPQTNVNNEDQIRDKDLYFNETIKTIEKKTIINVIKKKKIYFYIKKRSNKRGRLSNAYKEKHKYIKPDHDRSRNDNIIRKLKTSFTTEILKFVNLIYVKEYQELHKDSKKPQMNKGFTWLKKISKASITKIRTVENLKWLNTKLKDYLSSEVSRKNKQFKVGHNAKEIQKIIQEGQMEILCGILNMDIRTLFNIYATDEIFEIEELRLKLLTLKDIFNEEKAKNEEDINYIREVQHVAKNFEQIFKKKTERKK